MITVEIAPPCPIPLDESLKLNVNSIGILPIICEAGSPKYLLVAQQADQPGKPWGYIAGHTETGESAFDAARREFRQETGLEATENTLHYIDFAVTKKTTGKGVLYFGVKIPKEAISLTVFQNTPDGTIIFDPPVPVDQSEINQLALIPLNSLFSDNLISGNPYKPEYYYYGVRALRSIGIIEGEFPFENDPYL